MVRVINLEQAFASNQHKDFILRRLRNSSRTLSSLTPNILNVVYFSLKKCPNQNHILFCFLNSPRVASSLFYFSVILFYLLFIYLCIYFFLLERRLLLSSGNPNKNSRNNWEGVRTKTSNDRIYSFVGGCGVESKFSFACGLVSTTKA